MKIYTLTFEQNLPLSLTSAWDFFSSPHNLSKITPKEMGFRITSDTPQEQKMYPGILISYVVNPFPGIPMRWLTEITHVQEHEYFIDEQRFGPYALWHHQHHFKEVYNGVYMKDILTYALPFGFLGQLVNKMVVADKIRKIFEYRTARINELFGKHNTP